MSDANVILEDGDDDDDRFFDEEGDGEGEGQLSENLGPAKVTVHEVKEGNVERETAVGQFGCNLSIIPEHSPEPEFQDDDARGQNTRPQVESPPNSSFYAPTSTASRPRHAEEHRELSETSRQVEEPPPSSFRAPEPRVKVRVSECHISTAVPPEPRGPTNEREKPTGRWKTQPNMMLDRPPPTARPIVAVQPRGSATRPSAVHISPTPSLPLPPPPAPVQQIQTTAPDFSTDVSTILQLSTMTVKPADAPTFLLDCTTANFRGAPLVNVDKPCLYFGFRPIGVDSINILHVNSLADRSMYIKARINPTNSPFKIINRGGEDKQRVRPHSRLTLYVSFHPEQVGRCRSTLSISCYSGSEVRRSEQSVEYKCRLLGFGGQASVVPLAAVEVGKSKSLVMSASGRYQLVPDTIKKFCFSLENRGERDAFATIVVHDLAGEEITSENVLVHPVHVLLPKKSEHAKLQKIEIRMLAQTSHRPSCASSMSAACNATNNSSMLVFRILILWGEERQRQRIKMLERETHDKLFFLNRYFTVAKYSGEQSYWENLPSDELLSKEDFELFRTYLRVTTIEVLDNRGIPRGRERPASVLSTRPATGITGGLMEIEPDSTFRQDDTLTMNVFE